MASLSYIYHLVEEDRWSKARGKGYLPPTFAADGFIHATKEAHLLLPVANHFYTDVPGIFLCLRIDTGILKSPVKYESAAPVGDKPAHTKVDGGQDGGEGEAKNEEQPLFPHIYGPIDSGAVVAELAVARSEDGAFLSIEGLC